MINLDSITNENKKQHNEKCRFIPDHLHSILIIDRSGSRKTIVFNKDQDDIGKIYLYAKDLSELEYEFLIKKCEFVGINNFNDPNAFIESSNRMDDIYQNINDYNPSRKTKYLIVFDDKIADIKRNKKFQVIIKEFFIRCRNLNISLVFVTQAYFSVPKDVRLFDYENQEQKRVTKHCN